MLAEVVDKIAGLAKDAHAAAVLKDLPMGHFLVRKGNGVEVIETPRVFTKGSFKVASLNSLLEAIEVAVAEVSSKVDENKSDVISDSFLPMIMIDSDLDMIYAVVGDRTLEAAPLILIEWSLNLQEIQQSPLKPTALARLCRTEYFGWMPGEMASRFDSIVFENGSKVTYKSAHGGASLGRDIEEKTSAGGAFSSSPPREIEVSIPYLLEKDLPQVIHTTLYFEYDPPANTVQIVWTEFEKSSALQQLASEVEHAIRTKLDEAGKGYRVILTQ